MKSYIYAALIFSILLVTIPAVPLLSENKQYAHKTDSSVSSEYTEDTTIVSEKKSKQYQTIKILDITTGKVVEMSAFDYTVGAVCAEMPATFEHEALKAQAVAAYTYAVRQAKKSEISPDSKLCGAYFSNDSSKYQAFFTENQAKQYYGEHYDDYIQKIKAAVSEVKGEYIVFKDEPIIAAFHSVSSGKTESAKNVWGSDIAYLASVSSEYDTKSPKFIEEYKFEDKEMKALLEKAFKNITLSDRPQEWFSEYEKSDSETVLKLNVGDKKATGQEIRAALSLRSASFDIKYDNGFTVTVKGCGHGVGMSQYGANEMAKSGCKYKEILMHYYKDTEIIS